MRKHTGFLVTVGENGSQDEDQIAFDSYEISAAALERGLVKITFINGVSIAEDGDDIPVQEIILCQDAFVSFAVSEVPTVTITKAEYDSLRETCEILSDSETVADIRQSVIEMVTEIITKQKAGEDGEFVPAAELARLREIAESVALKEAALVREAHADVQALADEAELATDRTSSSPAQTFGTVNLVIGRDNG